MPTVLMTNGHGVRDQAGVRVEVLAMDLSSLQSRCDGAAQREAMLQAGTKRAEALFAMQEGNRVRR